ncbi:mannose-1-phosphate guanylyltransferase/mannose-6-phosphate isomerase [uncultured Devosia sp.]|uniref:mannose-1-phosphate guanylyltransferase/mannose-6-phosphate isomerase n=1 Tax=uncultured Devosia sp. TaxID=211434 RepID=UPI0035C96A07
MDQLIVPVILAGGRGTRLWPMSRSALPKQFLRLTGPQSLFQETLKRVAKVERYMPALVVTHTDYRFHVAEQALEMGAPLSGILLEPVARGTAAAITAAALMATRNFGPGTTLHILPADLAVTPNDDYWRAINLAATAAASGRLVNFGVWPTIPETGYRYIERGPAIEGDMAEVARFVGKPDRAGAQEMLAAGYLWNSGMLMARAEALLKECRVLAPQTVNAASAALAAAKADCDFVRPDPYAFASAPDITIDAAVLERTKSAAVLPVSFEWSDMGSWDAVWRFTEKDELHNGVRGPATLSNTTNSLVITDRAHVVVEGLDDIAAIACADAIYVGKLSEAQKVGSLVKSLREGSGTRNLTVNGGTAALSWGSYSLVLQGEGFRVTRLFVKPGNALVLGEQLGCSLHWVVVGGTGKVSIDGVVSLLPENRSILLPAGSVRRFVNPGKITVELIEVRTGSHLDPDSFTAIEHDYLPDFEA